MPCRKRQVSRGRRLAVRQQRGGFLFCFNIIFFSTKRQSLNVSKDKATPKFRLIRHTNVNVDTSCFRPTFHTRSARWYCVTSLRFQVWVGSRGDTLSREHWCIVVVNLIAKLMSVALVAGFPLQRLGLGLFDGPAPSLFVLTAVVSLCER